MKKEDTVISADDGAALLVESLRTDAGNILRAGIMRFQLPGLAGSLYAAAEVIGQQARELAASRQAVAELTRKVQADDADETESGEAPGAPEARAAAQVGGGRAGGARARGGARGAGGGDVSAGEAMAPEVLKRLADFEDLDRRMEAAGVEQNVRLALTTWVTVAVMQGGPEIAREACALLIETAEESRARNEADRVALAETRGQVS